MWLIKVYLTILEATATVVVVVVVNVVVVANTIVVALLIVPDRIISSCGQLMFFF